LTSRQGVLRSRCRRTTPLPFGCKATFFNYRRKLAGDLAGKRPGRTPAPGAKRAS
jgi:hypothetical protein